MKNPIDLINKRYNCLRASEKRVANFVQEHHDEVAMLSLQGLAKKCLTSDATVLRFCRSLGYFGFSDFKTALVTELLRQGHKTHLEVDPSLHHENKKNAFFQNYQQQLELTLRNCDYDVIRLIVNRMSHAGKICIVGLGGSAGVAHILCDSLGSLGIYSTCPNDPSLIRNLVPVLRDKDVLLGISHSGETEDVILSVSIAKERGVFTVGITNFSPSPLADIAQVSLITSVPENRLGGYSCQARISQLAVLELILYELSEELAKNQYANNHT